MALNSLCFPMNIIKISPFFSFLRKKKDFEYSRLLLLVIVCVCVLDQLLLVYFRCFTTSVVVNQG